MTESTERFFHTGSVALNYAEWPGEGPRLLLIHGWGGAWQGWENVISSLVKRFTVTAVDLRGFGRSGRSTDRDSRDTWTDDVAALVQHIVPAEERLFVAGHSLGGWVTMCLPSRLPGRIAGTVMEDPFTGPASQIANRVSTTPVDHDQEADEMAALRSVDEAAAGIRERYPDFSEQVVGRLAYMRFMTDPELVRRRAKQPTPRTYEEEMRAVDCPALVLQANVDKGGIMSDAEAERVKSLIPACTVVKWDNVGHSMHLARPHDFVKLLERFVRDAAVASRS
jgi:pimeloyl-ACP methyl ester carboxylesterase